MVETVIHQLLVVQVDFNNNEKMTFSTKNLESLYKKKTITSVYVAYGLYVFIQISCGELFEISMT